MYSRQIYEFVFTLTNKAGRVPRRFYTEKFTRKDKAFFYFFCYDLF